MHIKPGGTDLKNSVIIISCYFGELPATFDAWANSCEYNPYFDFLFITDQVINKEYTNLRIVNMCFEDVQKRAISSINANVCIPKPYKICDFRPTYGLLFSDYTSKYTFWGHCDIDMVFGDLANYFTDDLLEKYDRVQYLGHLSLYRNSPSISKFCVEAGMKRAFITEANCGFDEDQGIYRDFIKEGLRVYADRNFFDIYPYSSHMELDNIINKRMGRKLDLNYKRQLFVWYNGKVFRLYFNHENKAVWEQGLYIHMGRNQINKCDLCENYNTLIFSKHKIIACCYDSLSILESTDIIEEYNPYSNRRKIFDSYLLVRQKLEKKMKRFIGK